MRFKDADTLGARSDATKIKKLFGVDSD